MKNWYQKPEISKFSALQFFLRSKTKQITHTPPTPTKMKKQQQNSCISFLRLKNNCECGEKGAFLHCWWECKLVRPLWRTLWKVLNKLIKLVLPYDPGIPLLGIYLEKTTNQKGTCTPKLIAALLTIAKTWKQLKC